MSIPNYIKIIFFLKRCLGCFNGTTPFSGPTVVIFEQFDQGTSQSQRLHCNKMISPYTHMRSDYYETIEDFAYSIIRTLLSSLPVLQ